MGISNGWIYCFYYCVICIGFSACVQNADIDTSACYTDILECGQHYMACPERHTVIITDARYAHPSRTTFCSTGKLDTCSMRYVNSCCRPSARECYSPYMQKHAEMLLEGCMGSRTCFHLSPQVNRKCAEMKLSKSTYTIVTHRCVLNDYLIGYNINKDVSNDLIYLLYRIRTNTYELGTAHVYGCDVRGPEGATVKVRALHVAMVRTNGVCSELEIVKDGEVTSFSCDRTNMRFNKLLYEGSLPIEVNVVDVGGSVPEAAWVLLEGSGNITASCGQLRDVRQIYVPSPPSTAATSDMTATNIITTTTTTTTPTTTTTTTERTTVAATTTKRTTITITEDISTRTKKLPEPATQTRGKVDRKPTPVSGKEQETRSTLLNSDNVEGYATSTDGPGGAITSSDVQLPVAVVNSDWHSSAMVYGGINAGVLLLLVLIILVAVICYRRRRYRRYQSRKVEQKRNIPDGEERSCEKTDEVRDERDERGSYQREPDNLTGQGQKGDNSSYHMLLGIATKPLGSKVKGRKKKATHEGFAKSSTPRVSQPRDSDGYTTTVASFSGIDRREVTVEFYDNPGIKTTVDDIKVD